MPADTTKKLLRPVELRQHLGGMSRSTWQRWLRENKERLTPYKAGVRVTLWDLNEVTEVMAAQS